MSEIKGKRPNSNYAKKGNTKPLYNKTQKLDLLKKNRSEDVTLLKYVCTALEERVAVVNKNKEDAGDTKLSKEATSITLANVIDYFKDNGIEWPERNRVNTLISILIDIARCSVNKKLPDYHIAVRVMYFQERFQAYFTTEHNDDRYDILQDFEMFNCKDIVNVFFETSDGETQPMDIYEIGILNIPDNSPCE